MPTRTDGDLATLLGLGSIGTRADRELLDLFESRAEGDADRAFEVLVQRHGPLVLRVARGRLQSEEDARDAFQATFWLLARRSRSIRNRDALASWLFGVASRVAARAAVAAARRQARERRAALTLADSTLDPARREPDLMPTIHVEVNRLPARDRVAVILCDLEGLSYAEAAARLGCPVGAFKARLHRARARLRTRLVARGVAPLNWQPNPLIVPFPLVQAACRLALVNPTQWTPAVVASILILTRGVPRTMFFGPMTIRAAIASISLAAGTIAVALTTSRQDLPPQASSPSSALPALPRVDPVAEASLLVGPALAQVRTLAETMTDPDLQVRLLETIGQLEKRRGNLVEARESFNKALTIADRKPDRDDGFFPRLIYEVAAAQAQNGDRAAARRTFERAVQMIPSASRSEQYRHWVLILDSEQRVESRDVTRPTIDAYQKFLGTEREQPGQLTPCILSWGFLDLYGSYPIAWSSAARALTGDFAGAMRAIETNPAVRDAKRPEIKYQALIAVAQALRRDDGLLIGEVLGKVQQTLFEAPPSDRVSECLLVLMDVQINLARFDEAVATAAKIAAWVPQNGSIPRSLAREWMALAQAQLHAGDRAAAVKALRHSWTIIQTQVEQRFQVDLIDQLAALATRCGELEFAVGLAGSLGRVDRYQALKRVVRDLPTSGDAARLRQTR